MKNWVPNMIVLPGTASGRKWSARRCGWSNGSPRTAASTSTSGDEESRRRELLQDRPGDPARGNARRHERLPTPECSSARSAVPRPSRSKSGAMASLLRVRKEMGTFANLRPVEDLRGAGRRLVAESPRSPAASTWWSSVSLSAASISVNRAALKHCPTASAAATTPGLHHQRSAASAGGAFELARPAARSASPSVDKYNVMEASVLWREEIIAPPRGLPRHRPEPYVCRQLLPCSSSAGPRKFDVMVTDNMFGDILSDSASMITASLGMLPSASLGRVGRTAAVAPLRAHTWQRARHRRPEQGQSAGGDPKPVPAVSPDARSARDDAKLLEAAVAAALAKGARTADLAEAGRRPVSAPGNG